MSQNLFRGAVDGTALIDGTLYDPRVDLELGIKGLGAGELNLCDSYLSLSYGERRIDLHEFRLFRNRSEVRADGYFLLPEKFSADALREMEMGLEVSGDPFYLEDFLKEMKGAVIVSALLDGALTRPTGTVSIAGNNLELGVQKLEGVKIDSKLSTDGILFDDF